MTCPKAVSPSVSVNLFFSRLFLLLIAFAGPAAANDVKIIDARSSCVDRVCRFDVTLEHLDTGWDHYADSWRVVSKNGDELGKRVLLHPHENEQPFTRSLGGIEIPAGMNEVWIEAHDSVHGTGPERYRIELDL